MSKVDDLTIKRNLNRCTAIAVENIDRSCLRTCYAAVVTNEEGIILSEGYTHVPRGLRMCRKCYRKENKIESGTCYEKCRSIHAEQDAIIKLSQTDNADAIYDCDSYKEVFVKDILSAEKEIVISSVSLYGNKIHEFADIVKERLTNGVNVTVVTYEVSERIIQED